jgi:hypothetical protein
MYNDRTFCCTCGDYVAMSECRWIETGEDLFSYNRRLREKVTAERAAERAPASNPTTFQCPGCGRQFRWKPQLAGKQVKCKCGSILTVPDNPQAAAADAPRPKQPTAHVPARRAAPAAAPRPAADDDPLAALAGAAAETPADQLPHRTHRETTFAHSLRAHVDRFGRIDHHWPCGQCGTEVRGQPTGGTCPRCGAAIQMTNPRELRALRHVCTALNLLGWAGLVMLGATVLLLMAQAGEFLVDKWRPGRALRDLVGVLALVAAVIGVAGAFGAAVVDFIGKCVAVAIPKHSQARGLMITAIVLEPASLVVLAVGAAIAMAMRAPALMGLAGLLFSAALVAMFACVLAYISKAARYTQCFPIARSVGVVMIIFGGWVVLALLSGLFNTLALQEAVEARNARLSGASLRTGPMIGDTPAMVAIGLVFYWLANALGLIVIGRYAFLALGFRRQLKKLVAQCQAQAGG